MPKSSVLVGKHYSCRQTLTRQQKQISRLLYFLENTKQAADTLLSSIHCIQAPSSSSSSSSKKRKRQQQQQQQQQQQPLIPTSWLELEIEILQKQKPTSWDKNVCDKTVCDQLVLLVDSAYQRRGRVSRNQIIVGKSSGKNVVQKVLLNTPKAALATKRHGDTKSEDEISVLVTKPDRIAKKGPSPPPPPPPALKKIRPKSDDDSISVMVITPASKQTTTRTPIISAMVTPPETEKQSTWVSAASSDSDRETLRKKSCAATSSQSSAKKRLAFVSSEESEGLPAEEEEEEEENVVDVQLEQELALMDFWSHLLEAVHLRVSSLTTRTWGKKKTYEIYRLSGPACLVVPDKLEPIRLQIQTEFLAFYDNSDCRVYAVLRENSVLWVQFNIGLSLDSTQDWLSSNTKKQSKGDVELIAMIPPETHLIALTASRAASRSKYTPYVLSALESALTCSVVSGEYINNCITSKRVGELQGTEPMDLLNQAIANEGGLAVGRFATYAATTPNPITELETAATGNLLNREKTQQRLKVGEQHGREVSKISGDISSKHQTLVASNPSGTKTATKYVSTGENARKCVRNGTFGGTKGHGCAPRTCVRWDWKGDTMAADKGWKTVLHTDKPNTETGKEEASKSHLPIKFKCRVTLQGSDVFGGLRKMIELGIMKTPLPEYVEDAQTLSQEGDIISVDHGSINVKKVSKK